MDDVLPLLALQNIRGFGRRTISKLLDDIELSRLGTPSELHDAIIGSGVVKRNPDRDHVRRCWTGAEEAIERSERMGIRILSHRSQGYPNVLSKIPDAPALLHVRGNISAISADSVAVVGTRRPTKYGRARARSISVELARTELTIVSGLAEGIDTEVHESVLEVDATTVAVLAHGLDKVSPACNSDLAKKIVDGNGALVSEYQIGMRPYKGTFIDRDRIQSGLSLAVFVIETKEDGGTMHTASFCKEQGRALFVVEHPAEYRTHPQTRGNLELLSGGSIPLTEHTRFVSIQDELERIKKAIVVREDVKQRSQELLTRY